MRGKNTFCQENTRALTLFLLSWTMKYFLSLQCFGQFTTKLHETLEIVECVLWREN